MTGPPEGSASAETAGQPDPDPAVPPDVTTAALAAFDARDPDADVAALVEDSLDDDSSDPAVRRLRFASGDREVLVSVDGGTDEPRMVVDLQPPDGTLEVLTRTGAPVDVVSVLPGRWLISPPCTGLVSFAVGGGTRRLTTEWTRF